MQKIYLSDSGPKVSPAIYGFYRWNEEIENPSVTLARIIDLCLEMGINTFDHADSYGLYECEKLFGKIITEKAIRREDIVLFTKCGLQVPHSSKPDIRVKHYDTSGKHIRQSLENSLRNLRTDYVDIFLLDHLDHVSDIEETALVLRQLKESGKVKNIGVANFSVFQHQLLASYLQLPIVTNHIEFNLLNTSALDNGQIDYIKQRYMRPLASAPLAAGRIANGTDARAIRIGRKLEEIAKKYDSNIEAIAVAWINKTGALPLIGTVNEQRIRNIVSAFNIEIDNQDWYELYEVSQITD